MTLLKTPSCFWEGVICFTLSWCQILGAQDGANNKVALERSLILYQSGDFRRACQQIARESLLSPRNPIPRLYLLGCAIHERNVSSIREKREALDRVADSKSSIHQTAGQWLASGGYCLEGEREFSIAPTADAAENRFAMGKCYQAVGNATLASTEYEKALRLDPGKEDYYLSLAILLMAGGKSQEAGDVLLRSVARFPDSIRTIIAMSLLHLELGYPDRARLGYEKAKALAPESSSVWKLLGRIQMAEGSYEAAAESFEHAATVDMDDAQTHLLEGMAYSKVEGGADKALSELHRAAKLDSKLSEALILAASIYVENKSDFERATTELRAVLVTEPDSIRAHRMLMQIYQRKGMTLKATAEAQKIRSLSKAQVPPDPIKSSN